MNSSLTPFYSFNLLFVLFFPLYRVIKSSSDRSLVGLSLLVSFGRTFSPRIPSLAAGSAGVCYIYLLITKVCCCCYLAFQWLLIGAWIIERLDRKIMSRGLISNRRLVGSCFKMALTGSIIVEICDEMMAKMWRKPVEM